MIVEVLEGFRVTESDCRVTGTVLYVTESVRRLDRGVLTVPRVFVELLKGFPRFPRLSCRYWE